MKNICKLFLIVIIVAGCKKDHAKQPQQQLEYYITASFNGVQETFYPELVDTILNPGNHIYMGLRGTDSSNMNTFLLIFVTQGNELHVGTYPENNTPKDLTADYWIEQSNKGYSNIAPTMSFTSNLEYKDSSYIQGTFSGQLVNPANNGDMVTITNGSFKALRE